MTWKAIKSWLRFFFATWRFPNTYRELFRRISNCYLTPQRPGRATIKGFVTTCVTSSPLMIVTLNGAALFYVDRAALTVQTPSMEEPIPLYDRRVRPLREVFDEMIRNGVPFSMSDTNVTNLGI